ncbi:hypothetical protein [Paenibacillus wynnii]|uniref:Uncharacterized protein n=1 Tax=Paenibacillus wynnii TaxID=268407 RepID=A0A098ME34_9BACL|nr:hypothetical protein [Paenibacillus wynnii]KGE20809.1 hypothetical protein PWYN_01105 [Paenibacillus wynnii]
MSAKLITLVFMYDPEDEEPLSETLPAYLIGEDRALFVSEGLLWAHEVRRSEVDPEYFTASNEDAGTILAENVAADVIPALIERWAAITALEFIVRDLVAAPLLELNLEL